MARKQMVGLEGSETRARLLDAAERLMRDDGYAAVTSRRIGAQAGVRSPLVHYYFPSMDELFLALYRRRAEQIRTAMMAAVSADNPWLALWQLARDEAGTALDFEFMALANHRKALRAEIAAFTEEIRRIQHGALLRTYAERGLEPRYPPKVVTLIISAISQQVAVERQFGISFGHAETAAVMETTLRSYFSRDEDGGA